ncbi:DUF7116 family protein [Halomicrobium salinisoli]|uniref:DUF7116 family protein n=1 Tax=Halomicrobium salinisoli TaxID=2878391 RepID=UPI001CEFD0B4|nr:hypothetical protein [Halomicrobium salinisoli]
MGAVTTSLAEQAESIFDDLGYSVSRDGTDIRAERKWRTVRVQLDPDPDPSAVPTDGRFRCFVTQSDTAAGTYRSVAMADPDYEWAVIGVDDDGDYEVYRRTS